MKKSILLVLLALSIGIPGTLNAAEDPYGGGKLRNADPNAFINMGKQVFTYPDPGASTYESAKKNEEKQKENLDKKVDDAIDKAWGKTQ